MSPVIQASTNGQHQQDREHQSGQHDDRQEDVPAQREAEQVGLPPGHDPERAVGPAHVPVGLGAGGHLGGVVGAVAPHRVDRQERTHQGGHAEHDEEEPARLGGVHREHRVADHVVVGAARPGPLRVLVVDEQQHVGSDQREQHARDQQDVHGVEPRDDRVTRELPAEQEERHVRPDHGHRLHEAVGCPDAGAGEQVVGQRVAGEALERAQQQQQGADHPVQLARLAERTGEVDAHQVHEHRRDEEHRGPVVHLPHQQPGAYVEGDVQRGGVGLGHLQAAQLVVGAVVDGLAHARPEPQRQERAGQQQDHEAPQRDLAQHEGPVVGEDLADLLLGHRREAEPLVGPLRDRSDAVGLGSRRGLGAVAREWSLHLGITLVPSSSGRLVRGSHSGPPGTPHCPP